MYSEVARGSCSDNTSIDIIYMMKGENNKSRQKVVKFILTHTGSLVISDDLFQDSLVIHVV